MEFVASGDVAAAHCHMLSTGGMLDYAHKSDAHEFIVATETGMLYPLREQNPGKSFIPISRMAVCRYMKMITLPKLHAALREHKHEVRVPADIATRARLPIERMVAIT
jgi:quinolinate synthase